MNTITDITKTKRGNVQVKFHLAEIYDLLRDKLGYRFINLKGKGYYLKEKKEGLYEIVNFFDLSDGFIKYIRENFDYVVRNGEIGYIDFMNAYYEKQPIKNSNHGKSMLGKDFKLTDYNEHLLLMKIDFQYKRDYKVREMYKFFKINNFKETVDKIGNFRLEKPLFYKRLTNECFISFNRPFVTDKDNDCTFDFWKVNVKSEKNFLKAKLDDNLLINLMLGFDLERDVNLYDEIINNGC